MPIFTCFSIKDNNIEVHSFSKQRLCNIDVEIFSTTFVLYGFSSKWIDTSIVLLNFLISRYQIGTNILKECTYINVK